MKPDFESALAKAHKLQAMADPDSGATPAERETAEKLLADHCQRHGITADKLRTSDRRWRELLLFGQWGFPTDDRIHALAVATLFYVTDDGERPVKCEDYAEPGTFSKARLKKGKSKAKAEILRCVKAEVTDFEFDQWRECFLHYAPEFMAHQKKMQDQLAIARRAERRSHIAFININDLFCSAVRQKEPKPKKYTLSQRLAMQAAMNAVDCDSWKPKAGHLQPEFLLK